MTHAHVSMQVLTFTLNDSHCFTLQQNCRAAAVLGVNLTPLFSSFEASAVMQHGLMTFRDISPLKIKTPKLFHGNWHIDEFIWIFFIKSQKDSHLSDNYLKA